jgi:hypothetical protein
MQHAGHAARLMGQSTQLGGEPRTVLGIPEAREHLVGCRHRTASLVLAPMCRLVTDEGRD